MTHPFELSIIIPCFNEERRLSRTLGRIRDWLVTQTFSTEVIVVDDASADATARVAAEWKNQIPALRCIRTGEVNHGKGFAVRCGILEARGRIALFTDADLSAPIEEATKLLAALATHHVAFGSRAVDRRLIEVHQSRWRELAGIAFNKVVQLVTGMPWVDTQCGFKAFRRDPTRIIFEQQRIHGFGFDPELLFLAARHGLTAAEIPVRWSHDPDTKVRVLADGIKMIAELLELRWHWLLGRYPKITRP